jgi:hypothetical protein
MLELRVIQPLPSQNSQSIKTENSLKHYYKEISDYFTVDLSAV